jgi:long-chain acyl-CoA synthetase
MSATRDGEEEEEVKTLIEKFLDNVEKFPDKRFMTQPMGGGDVRCWTLGEVLEEAERVAAYLESLRLERGSRIALCSKNCGWWIIADLAIWLSGHVTVPVYPTLTADSVSYILEHSESKLLFVGKLDEHPWKEMRKGVPAAMHTVSFPLSPAQEHGDGGRHEKWDDIIKKFDPIQQPVQRQPDELATIIYTSGTTGRPKGVMHNFKTMYVTTVGIGRQLTATSMDRYLSYLPLAHGMERWLGECVALYTGEDLFFAESLTTFVEDLQRARPTLFLSVPRLWTKFQLGVFKKMPPKKLDFLMGIPIVGYLVKKKVLKGLGLDQVRIAGSGSAPIPPELIKWYRRLGLELLEGYGMTENFNYSHLSLPGKTRPGYVGNAYPDVEVRIAEDGEIQVKSPGQMMGYYKNEQATRDTMTDDGYLRTGDRGEIDSQGRLKIIGRTKEIFKTSKGKYVAPAPIENKLIDHPRVELACVSGSSYPQPHAIIQLSEDAKNAVKKNSAEKDTIEKELEAHLQAVNATLDQHEQMDFAVVIEEDWLPENGFVTPTNKVIRRKIEETYDPMNDEWYESEKRVIWYGW